MTSACQVPNIYDKPDAIAVVVGDTVYVQGVRFARAPRLHEVRPDQAGDGPRARRFAASLGLDERAFARTVASCDLYLLDTAAKRPYADNITVSGSDGAKPDDDELEMQLGDLGAV